MITARALRIPLTRKLSSNLYMSGEAFKQSGCALSSFRHRMIVSH